MSIKNKHKEKKNTLVLGYEVGHIVDMAIEWWNGSGREMMKHRQFSSDTKEQQEALDATNPLHPNYLGQSNILLGLPFELLRQDEQYRIVKTYLVTLRRAQDGDNSA